MGGLPSMNSTRHVVQRAFPPQAWRTSTCASSSIASTSRFPCSTSTGANPSTVSFGICSWLLCVALAYRWNQVLAEGAGEIILRRESPVAARGRVVDVRRPGIDDRLTLDVGLPRDLRARERARDDVVNLLGGRT